jgi:hypothetical protein
VPREIEVMQRPLPPDRCRWARTQAENVRERPALLVRQVKKPLNPVPTPDSILEQLIAEGVADLRAVGAKPTGGAIVRYVRLRGGHRRGGYIRALAKWLLGSDVG